MRLNNFTKRTPDVVAMMNDKAQQLGLAQTTHFANSVGIFDEQNYTTAYDMAVIMETALSNEMSREVITTHVYKTSVTEQHPEGITLVNKFFRKIKTKNVVVQFLVRKQDL